MRAAIGLGPASTWAISITTVIALLHGCGGSSKPAETAPVATAAALPPSPPPCTDAPVNPGDAIAKEPAVLNECLAGVAKIEPNLCGQAKIAFEIGRDGKVTRAEVASSSLPTGMTDYCIRARLSALQYACPRDGSATYTIPLGLPIPPGACPGGTAPAP
jgi:hypothetical protein